MGILFSKDISLLSAFEESQVVGSERLFFPFPVELTAGDFWIVIPWLNYGVCE